MAFITETWLNEKIDDAAVCIDSYALARRDRIDKLGGGVCAFIKSSIPFKILSEFEDTNLKLCGFMSDPINFIVATPV